MPYNPIAPILEIANDYEEKQTILKIDDSQIDSFIEVCDYNPKEVDQEVTCTQCGAFCDSQVDLTDHLRKFHAHSSTLSDENPQRIRSQNGNSIPSITPNTMLQSHEEDENSIASPHVCPVCQKKFTQKRLLKAHFEKHIGVEIYGERKYHVCQVCQKKLATEYALKLHLSTHTGHKPYKCTRCDKSFIVKSRLTKHMFSHLSKHTADKLFKCTICGKGYGYSSNLKAHILTHSGEKQFSCRDCNLSFRYRTGLRRHMKSLHDEIKYVCQVCQKSFTTNYYLKVHVRKHSGDKPYKCTICDKSFIVRSKLNEHLLKHSGNMKSSDDDNIQSVMDSKIEIDWSPIKHEIEIKDAIGYYSV